ncbi:hypothetical protein CORC01_08633 [Colletotrichum orchidophilum]|uniref:Uncharacterized protein n=1 Tax=Colletotrichum orchidophilum TaxID=1209926 RepID=A0A1G4B415_9PEZI|nr:uncharacterized protein CORC01_08633 [Colletotrichum orchidophilum]OHE96096.1 hypothetical protein CORC01_08633 [Colletotrichum orchidophilum]
MTGPALPVEHPKPGLGCFNHSITAIWKRPLLPPPGRTTQYSYRWHTSDHVYLLLAKAVVGPKGTEMLHGLPVSHNDGVIPLSLRRQARLWRADALEMRAFNLSPDPERYCLAAWPVALCLRHRV